MCPSVRLPDVRCGSAAGRQVAGDPFAGAAQNTGRWRVRGVCAQGGSNRAWGKVKDSARKPIRPQLNKSAPALVNIAALADRVQAGEVVTCPGVEATGDLLAELSSRGRVRLCNEWQGNTLLIVVGPREGDVA